MERIRLLTLSTIQSATKRNGMEATAPVVIVRPRREMGVPMSSFRYTKRNVSTKPQQLPRMKNMNKKTSRSTFRKIFFRP